MANPKEDKRKLHALRRHIDALLANGALMTKRDPLTLLHAGQSLRVKHGMLVGYYEVPELIEPIADHDWPDTLRQLAADICMRQLDEALKEIDSPAVTLIAGPATSTASEATYPAVKIPKC